MEHGLELKDADVARRHELSENQSLPRDWRSAWLKDKRRFYYYQVDAMGKPIGQTTWTKPSSGHPNQ